METFMTFVNILAWFFGIVYTFLFILGTIVVVGTSKNEALELQFLYGVRRVIPWRYATIAIVCWIWLLANYLSR
jgi:hypothetical protein